MLPYFLTHSYPLQEDATYYGSSIQGHSLIHSSGVYCFLAHRLHRCRGAFVALGPLMASDCVPTSGALNASLLLSVQCGACSFFRHRGARRPLGISTSVLLVGLRHLCRRASAHPLCGRCGMRTWEFRHPDGTRSRTYLLERCSQYFPIKRASLLRACLTAAQRASLHVRCGMVVVSWRLDLIWDLEFLGS